MRRSSPSSGYYSPRKDNWCWSWRIGQAYLFPRQSLPRRRHPRLPARPLDRPPGHCHGLPVVSRSAFCSSIWSSIFDRRVVFATEGRTTTVVVRRVRRFQPRPDSSSLLVAGSIGGQPQTFPTETESASVKPRCPSFQSPGRSTSPGKIVNVVPSLSMCI